MQPRTQSGNNQSVISRYLILAALVTALAVTGLIISATSTSAALPAKGISSQGAGDVGNKGSVGIRDLGVSVPLSGCWTRLNTPNFGTGGNYLLGGDAVSANDVWAVGYYTNTSGMVNSLIEHGVNGNWSVVPAPDLGTHSNWLQAVTAISANDVWAVGDVVTGTLGMGANSLPAPGRGNSAPGPLTGNLPAGLRAENLPETPNYNPYVIHWNGSTWSNPPIVVPPGNYFPQAIDASPSGNVVFVGYAQGSQGFVSYIERYDPGTNTWVQDPSPNPGGTGGTFLLGVKVVSPNSAFAVGDYANSSGVRQNLIGAYNGSSWTVVPGVPNSGNQNNYLSSIARQQTLSYIVIGGYTESGVQKPAALSSTDGGVVWTSINPPATDPFAPLTAVDCSGSGGCMAVGTSTASGGESLMALLWNGSIWGDVSPPAVNNSNALAITLLGPSLAYDVFGYIVPLDLAHQNPDAGIAQTLVMNYGDPCGLPTPIPTSTPGGPTSTRTTAPTQTPGGPTATPQACTIQFSDVPVGSTFYSFIHCLACRNIVSGYPDGTFKPNNNVTRGQLSKVVSNAAGFSEAQPTQMFEDVAVGSTFQLFIGRLASRGYIGGYPCGGPGEPCNPPGNLPYFRPGNNATRGQIAKIDSNAATFNDNPTGQQFEDVAVGSTYYTYTYRLVSRSIMSGYPCGGPGEPCVPPGNLPYFRPNNNATRGQTSKIVANTFFPNCQTPARGGVTK